VSESFDKHAVVIGASGMIGQPLCHILVDRGWKVAGVARFADLAKRQQLESIGVTTVCFDIESDAARDLPDADVVFLEVWNRDHFLNQADRDAIWALNYEAIGRLVDRYAGAATIINGSTASLYGPRCDRPSHEDDPLRPHNEYALSRLAQERLIDFLCAQAGGHAIHLRYCHANDEHKGWIRRIADSVLAERSFGHQPDLRVQVMGLLDFVRCTALAGESWQSVPSVINVTHPQDWSYRELAERVTREVGRGRVQFEVDGGGLEDSIWVDTTRMVRAFGPPQDDLDQLIARVAKEALRSHVAPGGV